MDLLHDALRPVLRRYIKEVIAKQLVLAESRRVPFWAKRWKGQR